MATIPVTTVAGPYKNEDATPQFTQESFTACDAAGNTFNVSKRTLLVIRNTNATTARTVTFPSSYDPFGRLSPITAFSIVAGDIYFRWFDAPGWESSAGGGTASFTASGTGLEAMAIQQ